MRVLIIEPDVVLSKAYASAFAEHQITATVVSSGQRAIEAIDTESPQCVVLEVQLAGHSGIDFLHEFRSYEDWGRIPVVIYSSVPQSAFGVEGTTWERLGVVRYLYKNDVSAAHMVAVVRALVHD